MTITHIEDLADENRARHLLEDTYNEVISWVHSARLEHGIGGDTQAASEHTQKARDAMHRAMDLESLLISWAAEQEMQEHTRDECPGAECPRDHAEEERWDRDCREYHMRAEVA